MRRYAAALAGVGRVVAFDYPYQVEKRRRPDPLPKLVAAHEQALQKAKASATEPVFLLGKSMGGRIGCHVALSTHVQALVCFGYPLCGQGDPNKRRDGVLKELRRPVLFVQGTRDALCPLPLLHEVRQQMTARSELFVVEGGDHSLLVTQTELKRQSTTQAAIERAIVECVQRFVTSVCAEFDTSQAP
jgi:hypothetical protein